jgi:hypothetical protein
VRQSLYGDRRARGNFMKGMRGTVEEGMFAPGQFDSIENSLTSIPEYLLFRYFDFDVRPGVAYRYRARLTLTNPNFGTPPQLINRPEVAQGKTRLTPWSKPTPPTVIPRDVEVFLADVTSEYGVTQAKMKVVQWLPEVGTLVEKTLPIAPGSRIAGRAAADVVEPGVILKERQVAFAAPSVVVDTETGPAEARSRNFHAALTLPPAANGQLEAVEQTLVVNESGDLEVLTPYTDVGKRTNLESYVKNMLDYFAFLRPATTTEEDPMMGEGDGLDFLPGGEGGGEGLTGTTPAPRRGRYSRPRNPLSRRGNSQSKDEGGGHGGGP